MKEKRCTGRCKEIKPLSEFSNKKAYRDGKNNQCRDCVREGRTGKVNVKVPPARINSNCMVEWWV